MLRSLLADRFKLAVHWETRTGPIYRLVAARGGTKLEKSDGSGELSMSKSAEAFVFRSAEIQRLAGLLSSYADRIVVDDTGLDGLFNFTIKIPEEVQIPAYFETGADPSQKPKSDGASLGKPTGAAFAEALKPLGCNWWQARARCSTWSSITSSGRRETDQCYPR